MTDTELKAKGWQQVGDWWMYPCDAGLSHERAHTRDQAIQRTAKATLQSKRMADVWVLPPRSVDDGIEMGFIHPRRISPLNASAMASADTQTPKENGQS